jgi:macrolide transport system ATP-binding/permease protein
MSAWSRIRSLFGAAAGRENFEAGMQAEIEFHLECRTRDLVARGIPAEEAGRQARAEFGSTESCREEGREARGLRWLDEARGNLRFSLRMLRKQPGFALTAILTLGLGIGLTTTVFTIYDAVALRPLPVRGAGSLDRVVLTRGAANSAGHFTVAQYEWLRDRSRTLEGVAALSPPTRLESHIPGDTQGQLVTGRFVSNNYFSMLGVNAAMGRTFLPGDGPVAVLSHLYWQRRFAGDRSIVGKTIFLGATDFNVIGVSPANFLGTGAPALVPDCWIPFRPQTNLVDLLVMRKSGASRQEAQTELGVLANRIRGDNNEPIHVSLKRAALFERAAGEFDAFLDIVAVLTLAVGSVLAIGCVNLLNLLLARGVARRREIAMRFSLGATRGRVIRQLCTESAVLGLFGGAAGLLFSVVACRLLSVSLDRKLMQFGNGGGSFTLDLNPDVRIFAFTAAVSILTGVLVGLAPARRVTLKGTPVNSRFRDVLMAGQLAACLTLLIGAGLLGKAVFSAVGAQPGFETGQTYRVSAGSEWGGTPEQRGVCIREAVEALQASAGVQSVCFVMQTPLLGHSARAFTPLDSPLTHALTPASSFYNMVSDRYFDTMRVPLLRGRGFTAVEAASRAAVAVISESTAARYWPGRNAVGRSILVPGIGRNDALANRTFVVIGIAKNVRSTNLSKADRTYIYLPATTEEMTAILIRTNNPPGSVAALVHDALNPLLPRLAGDAIVLRMEEFPLALQRMMTQAPAFTAAVLGLLAMALASIGVYGVVAFLASRRTHEIGIRMALGARRSDVLALILRQSAKPLIWGVGAGLAGAAILSGLLGAMVTAPDMPDLLFGVSPWDPITFAGTLGFLILVVMLASGAPALRATRIDPVQALRCE